jgi:hypothetical protein
MSFSLESFYVTLLLLLRWTGGASRIRRARKFCLLARFLKGHFVHGCAGRNMQQRVHLRGLNALFFFKLFGLHYTGRTTPSFFKTSVQKKYLPVERPEMAVRF